MLIRKSWNPLIGCWIVIAAAGMVAAIAAQAQQTAGVTQERTLFAVACSRSVRPRSGQYAPESIPVCS